MSNRIITFFITLAAAIAALFSRNASTATQTAATTTPAETPAETVEAVPVEEEVSTIPTDAGHCPILGIYADANGEKQWDNLDPARWVCYVRVIGSKKGKVAVGLAVGTVGGDKVYTSDVQPLTFGYDAPVDTVQALAMDFPPYTKYTCAGVHPVIVRVGYYDDAGDPVWTHSKEYSVTVVKA